MPMLTEAGEGGPGSPTAEGQQDEELLAEARVLRQHKTRLETRMQILEDHNKQLESQLRRLRELLLQVLHIEMTIEIRSNFPFAEEPGKTATSFKNLYRSYGVSSYLSLLTIDNCCDPLTRSYFLFQNLSIII